MRILDKCVKLYREQQYEVFTQVDPNQHFPKRYWLMSAETLRVLVHECHGHYFLLGDLSLESVDKFYASCVKGKLFDIPIRVDETVTKYAVQLAFILECYEE